MAWKGFGRRDERVSFVLAAAVGAMAFGAEAPAAAHARMQASQLAAEVRSYAIPAGTVGMALNRLAEENGVQMVFLAGLTRDVRTSGLKGDYTLSAALDALLGGTGLGYRLADDEREVFIVLAQNDAVRSDAGAEALPPIDVGAEASRSGDSRGGRNDDRRFGPGGRQTGYAADKAKSTLKTDTPLLKTPLSIQVVTRQTMDDRQVVNLKDAVIENVSGVSLGYQFYDQFVIRGFENINANLYRNGLRFPFASNLETSNLQSIEILKGPAAMLYGRVEPGGIVNLAPKRPQATPYFSIQEQAGLFGHTRTLLDATGPVTDDKTLLYRLNLSYLHKDSFRDFVNQDNFLVAPTVSWRPTDRFTFNFDFEYQRTNWVDDGGDTAIPAVGNRPAGIPISRYLQDPAITTRNRNGQDRVVFAYDWAYEFIDDWTFTNRFAYTDIGSRQSIPFGGRLDETTGVMNRALWHIPDGRRTTLSTNFDVQGKVVTGPFTHKLLAGFDYYDYDQKFRGICCDNQFTSPINIYAPVYGGAGIGSFVDNYYYIVKDKWKGIYAQDQISFWDDRIHVLLGGRHDWAETGNRYSPNSFAEADALFVKVPTSANSPRVGLLVQPLPWLSVYGNYTRSYGSSNGLSNGAPLPPQSGVQFEGGVKAELLDGGLIATFAYFDIDKKHITRPVPGTPFVRPIGAANSHGVEFDLNGRIDDNWSVIATYSHIEARVTSDEDAAGTGGLTGKLLASVPRNAANLWVKYEADGMWKGLGLGGGVIYVDKRPGDDANTFELPAYARVDGMASYKFQAAWLPGAPDLTFQFNIKNLLGTTYYESSQTRFNIVPGAPRSFLASIRAEF